MHPYIPHLLEDIENACRGDKIPGVGPQTLAEQFEEIEKWVSGKEEEYSFGYYCGLSTEIFPPAEQLTDKEMKIILKAFKKLLNSWNQNVELPKKIPTAFAYKLTISILNKETSIVSSGYMCFDFCSGYAPDCALEEYCNCKKYWDNDATNENES